MVPTAGHHAASAPPDVNGNGNYWYCEEGRELGSTEQRYEEGYHRRGSGVRDTVVMM